MSERDPYIVEVTDDRAVIALCAALALVLVGSLFWVLI